MISMTIVCPVCRGRLGLEYWEVFAHATCEPPSEEALQAQAKAMARRFYQFQRRLALAASGVVLTHGNGAPKRRRHRGGRGRKKVAQ